MSHMGPAHEYHYLSQLRTSGGAPVQFRRIGGCCPFETENSPMGQGMLDKYEVAAPGENSEPVVLFLNMYDFDAPKAPKGFSVS